jgi:E3 ubiquitin-protein ligase TRIP12
VDPSLHRSLLLLHQLGSEAKSISLDSSLSEAEQDTKIKALTIQGAIIDEMCLDFTLPGYPDIELIPKGADIMVSAGNVQEYVERVTDLTVGNGIRSQVQAFRKGFSKVFPIYDLHSFSVPELIVLLGGDAKEDWGEEGEELKKMTILWGTN